MLRLSPRLRAFVLAALLAAPVYANDVLKTNGFAICQKDSPITVQRLNISFDRTTNEVTFDVAGTSTESQKVSATLVATAYGKEVYRRSFDPCEENIDQLCPVPSGTFAAKGQLPIPDEFASMIPAIAFSIPDLDGIAKLTLNSLDTNTTLACLESIVDNGKSVDQPALPWVTGGIAAAALLVSGISGIASAASGANSGGPSPNFADVVLWFQAIAMNGMLSVDYPPVYQQFTKNFGWSTGLIPWESMERSIDSFRAKTGGNLTENNVEFLKNATLVRQPSSQINKRSLDNLLTLLTRDLSIDQNNSTTTNGTSSDSKVMHYVNGMQAYVEKLSIPDANTFMTVLLIFCIVIAACCVGILLFKVILELWALCGKYPESLRGFRKRYWGFLGTTIVRLILLLYGVWVLYCLYQFRVGDSWAARVLAGVTLALFTGILLFFVVRIWLVARKAKHTEGGADALYQNKPYLRRYGLFYDQFKESYWWLFIPLIVYAFMKAAFIALGDKHGLIQSAGHLACEAVLLILLLWSRPFNTRSGNIINIVISVVRVLSVACVLIFVEQLGIEATAKSVTGVVLLVMQSVLTALLAILIAVNALILMCKKNPNKKKRDAEKAALAREQDALTPLDPRNSLLMNQPTRGPTFDGKGRYQLTPTQEEFPARQDTSYRGAGAESYPLQDRYNGPPVPFLGGIRHERSPSGREALLSSSASMGGQSTFTHSSHGPGYANPGPYRNHNY